MKVRKAVIPAAGLGTRMLPATKTVPKEMLPMVDKPVIQYIIEEAVAAGIEDILIVTNRAKSAMDDYCDYYPELETRLLQSGKESELVEVRRAADLANIFYRLRLIEAYGTGILRIHECYAGAAVQPAIEATDHAFKITLPNLNFSREAENTPPARPATSLGKREARVQKVIGLCRENGWVVRKDVEAALGVSQATAILLLREMTRDGLLEKQGTAKNLRYYLAEM